MFDNILHQDRAVSALSADLASDRLPQALLFHGPDYSGKLSTALELARVLSCQATGAPWGCGCANCAQNKTLLSPYLMMLGQRYFNREIRACGAALLADCREGTRYLLLRSVRKLLRRFDPVLMEGETKLEKAFKPIEKLEEKLDPFLPDRPPLAPHEVGELLDEIYKLSASLVDLLPQDGLSINMIRRITYWAHTADANQNKFILIENAELMNEATRNSLLKVLEEPPPAVYFILMTSQKTAIMPTILSRVRPYAFAGRGDKEGEVIERVFRQPPGKWPDLRTFFVESQPGGHEALRERAALLAELLMRRAGLGCLLPARRQTGLEAVLEGLGKDKSETEDLVRATQAGLCAWLPRIDTPEALAALAGAGLAPIQAADRLQAVIRRLQSLYALMSGYNLSAAALIERVWFEAGEGRG
jgi:DNA polymerase-3 subunit gamma/tau